MSKKIEYKGVTYPSISALCRAKNVNRPCFQKRIEAGFSLEEAIETPEHINCIPARDHLGNDYPSLTSMAKAYGLTYKIVSNRLDKGLSLEEALTKPIDHAIGRHTSNKECVDHLGNKFTSKTEMFRYWNIQAATFNSRAKKGWDLKRILTTPMWSKK